jgi:hypothetical protein
MKHANNKGLEKQKAPTVTEMIHIIPLENYGDGLWDLVYWKRPYQLIKLHLMNITEWEGAKKTVVIHFKVRRNWREVGIQNIPYIGRVSKCYTHVMLSVWCVKMCSECEWTGQKIVSANTSSVFGRIEWEKVEAAAVDPQSPYVQQSQQDTAQINGSIIRGTDTVDVFARVCGILSTMDKYDTKALQHCLSKTCMYVFLLRCLSDRPIPIQGSLPDIWRTGTNQEDSEYEELTSSYEL